MPEPFEPAEYADVLSVEQCERLISLFGGNVERSLIGPARVVGGNRTSWSAKVTAAELPDDITTDLVLRVSDICRVPVSHLEPWEIIRYRTGEYYSPHYDYVSEPGPSGQRVFSALLYLRAPRSGGGTDFPMVKRLVPPIAGKLVVWRNLAMNDRKQLLALHTSKPVTAGEKWSFITWVRERPYQP